jgi:hypothetical protein
MTERTSMTHRRTIESGEIMKKIYKAKPRRAAFAVCAVAMTAITLALMLVVPAKVESALIPIHAAQSGH